MGIDTRVQIHEVNPVNGHQIIHGYKLNTPGIEKHLLEQWVTDGLGYAPIEHYEDTQLGLTRHLVEMEIRVAQGRVGRDRALIGHLFFDLLNFEKLFYRAEDSLRLGVQVLENMQKNYYQTEEQNKELRDENSKLKTEALAEKEKAFFLSLKK